MLEIREIKPTKENLKKFTQFQIDLYADNPYYVPPLISDDVKTLSPKLNPAFDFCESVYYMAYRDGKPVGRIAGIINRQVNGRSGDRTARFGFIDFIDDREVSAALLGAVEDYGRAHGMTEIVGPLGFTDMDPEGMLTFGFDQLGTMPTIYNYPYYPEHMEGMDGYVKDNDYVEYKLFVPEKVPEKYAKIAAMIEKRYDLHVKKITKRDIYKNGYGKKIFDLINMTFKDLYGYSELTDRQIEQYINMYFSFVDLSLITLVEDHSCGNKLVGIGITIPSLSHALQKCRRGRLLPFGWWHVLRAVKFHKTDIVDLLLLGVLPEYRAKGVNAMMFADLIPRYYEYGFKWGESQVEMETNEGVQSQWDYLETEHHKRRRCYKKEL